MVFAEVCWRYSCCFRKEPGKVSVIFKSEFLSYFLYAFTGIYQAPFGSCHNFILYVLADTEPRRPFNRFVEIHERDIHHACIVTGTVAVLYMLFEQVSEGDGMLHITLGQAMSRLLGGDSFSDDVDDGKRQVQCQCLWMFAGLCQFAGQDGKQRCQFSLLFR